MKGNRHLMKKKAHMYRLKCFQRYCEQTTLHGWQYIASENGLYTRFLWIFVVFAASISAVALCLLNLQDYIDANPTTNIEVCRKNTTTMLCSINILL